MGQQTDSQGAAGVVDSESTWFCETHAYESRGGSSDF